jgi:hypothetical protein
MFKLYLVHRCPPGQLHVRGTVADSTFQSTSLSQPWYTRFRIESFNQKGEQMPTLLDDLVLTYKVIAKKERWTKGRFREARSHCYAFCAVGVCEEYLPGMDRKARVYKALMSALGRRYLVGSHRDALINYNDDGATTHSHITAMWEAAIALERVAVEQAKARIVSEREAAAASEAKRVALHEIQAVAKESDLAVSGD